MRPIKWICILILLVSSTTLYSQATVVIRALRTLFSPKTSVSTVTRNTLIHSAPVYEYSRMLPYAELEVIRKDNEFGSWFSDFERRMSEIKNGNSKEYWDAFNNNTNPYGKELENILGKEYLKNKERRIKLVYGGRDRYVRESEVRTDEIAKKSRADIVKALNDEYYASKIKYDKSLDLDLVQIQRILKERGFQVTVDGLYGPETKTAICKAFKKNPTESIASIAYSWAKEKLLEGRNLQKFMVVDNIVDLAKNKYSGVLMSEGKIKDIKELSLLENFYEEFYSKIESMESGYYANSLFFTFLKSGNSEYMGIMGKLENQVGGFLYKFDLAEKKNFRSIMTSFRKRWENELSRHKDGIIYIYGDHLPAIGNDIIEKAAEHNITVISRNTQIKKSFKETEKVLMKLRDKNLDGSTTTFFNGTPQTPDEALFQSFKDIDANLLKRLKTDIDTRASAKVSNIMKNMEDLKRELMEGENDILLIVAHSDKESLYFGSEKISINELSALPKRIDRKKERVAILLSCYTGDLFSIQKTALSNSFKTFPQVLIEQNFVDFVVVPSSTIDGNEVLLIIDEIDKHRVLTLRQQFDNLIEKGRMTSVAWNSQK